MFKLSSLKLPLPPPPKNCSLEELQEYSKCAEHHLRYCDDSGKRYDVFRGETKLLGEVKLLDGFIPDWDFEVLEEIMKPENLEIFAEKYYYKVNERFPKVDPSKHVRHHKELAVYGLIALIRVYMLHYGRLACDTGYLDKDGNDVYYGFLEILINELYPAHIEKMYVNFKPAKQ